MSEQANRVKEIVKQLRKGKKRLSHIAWQNALNPGSKELLDLSETCNEAADLLDQLQRETEPVPLTKEDLSQMRGKPVWVEIDKQIWTPRGNFKSGWYLILHDGHIKTDQFAIDSDGKHLYLTYKEYWDHLKVYAHEPKGEAKT